MFHIGCVCLLCRPAPRMCWSVRAAGCGTTHGAPLRCVLGGGGSSSGVAPAIPWGQGGDRHTHQLSLPGARVQPCERASARRLRQQRDASCVLEVTCACCKPCGGLPEPLQPAADLRSPPCAPQAACASCCVHQASAERDRRKGWAQQAGECSWAGALSLAAVPVPTELQQLPAGVKFRSERWPLPIGPEPTAAAAAARAPPFCRFRTLHGRHCSS